MGMQRRWYVWAGVALFVAGPGTVGAQPAITTDDFKFDMQPLPADAPNRVQNSLSFRPYVICNIPGQANFQCNIREQWFFQGNFADDFTTSFLQEVVNIQGVNYYHVMIDQQGQGFTQEFYMKGGGVVGANFQNPAFTDSGGSTCFPGPFDPSDFRAACMAANNATDPLRSDARFTGNGTGNPRAIMMRQVVNQPENGFSQEYIKPFFDKKPIIRQNVTDGTINSEFAVDMSEIDYDTDGVSGKLTNRLTVNSPGIPGSPTFDVGGNVNDGTNVSAGRYTWTPDRTTGLGGTYTYFDGSIDPVHSVDWSSFRDPAQNP